MPETPKLYSVTDLNLLAKGALERVPELSYVSVRGEIASYKEYPSAIYFDIKDQKSTLTCVMWGSYASRLTFSPKVGDEVVVFGSITLYAQKGRYQFNALSLSLFGKGEALLALQALKEKLQKEGLFDQSRKKEIPSFPTSIGIIVGKDSAAEADLKTNIHRRWPLTELHIYHALVQGKNAPEDIVKALNQASNDKLDTLILARGGGSNDDLDAFNDERVVRAFAAISIPKIAAVGHEIDFTLVDYVADKRVSTPTGAAEAATPDQNEIYMGLLDTESSLISYMKGRIQKEETKLLSLANRPIFLNPSLMYEKGEEKLEALKKRMELSFRNVLLRKEGKLDTLESKLNGLDHHKLLDRGYSLVYNDEGNIVKSVKDVKVGSKIVTRLKDGKITSVVEGDDYGK